MSYKIFNKLTFLLVFSVLVFGAAQSALAVTKTVTKTADTNDNACNADCSLREAVGTAIGGDTIVFAAGLAGQTITLGQGVIKINKNLVINGLDGIKVSGNNASRIFHVTGGVNVTIDNLDLKNGFATYPDVLNFAGEGGAVLVTGGGSLTFGNSTVSLSSATSGGALAVYGGSTLKLNNMQIVSNSAIAGGGIEGGDSNTVVEITDSVIKYNQAQRGGGLSMTDGALKLTGTSVYSNSAITNDGRGGGLYLTGTNFVSTAYGTNFVITFSTISGNTAFAGGGVYNQGNLVLVNSTLSGNKATKTNGGGLLHNNSNSSLFGELKMMNTTITQNSADLGSGGGVYRSGVDYGELNAGNTIIAGNSNLNNSAPDVKGKLNSWGCNLFGSTSGMNMVGNPAGVIVNPNPALAPLDNNGGKTKTHLPFSNSPAVNAGCDLLAIDENGFMLSTDQRGKGRFNGTVDIGSVERYNERVLVQ